MRKMNSVLRFILFGSVCLILLSKPLYPNSISDSSNYKKVGLVLAGGSALGFSHIGLLEVIDSLEIPIDYVAGTSMGGLIGAVYALGFDTDEIKQIIYDVDWSDLFSDKPKRNELPLLEKVHTGRYQLKLDLDGFTPKLPTGLIQGQKIKLLFNTITNPFETFRDFNRLPIPFACVAGDLITGKAVTINNGSLASALRATMSIPSAFSPVEIGEYFFVDGGVINNYPVDVVREMGADIVLGINLNTGSKSKEDLKTLFDIIDRTTDLPRLERLTKNIEDTDFYFETDVSNYSLMDFSRSNIEALIRVGKQNAIKNIEKLLLLKTKLNRKTDWKFRKVSQQIRNDFQKTPPRIFNIVVTGNRELSFEFIYSNLGIKLDSYFNTKMLNERITYLYSLGYFEKISYELIPEKDGSVTLILDVKEESLAKFNAGFRYNDYYKLVAIVGIDIKSILFKGTRLIADYQFGSLRKFDSHFSYPSQTLNLPVYPFLVFNYKSIPFDLFDPAGRKFAKYKDRAWSVGGGFGLAISNLINIEAELNREFIDIKPEIALEDAMIQFPKWDDQLSRLMLRFKFDKLDNSLLPKSGVLVQAKFEKGIKNLGSEVDYNKLSIDADYYFTIKKHHTFEAGGSYMDFYDKLPDYKFFYFGGPNSFVGIDYNQAAGSNFNIARVGYRYEYKSDIAFNAKFNIGFNSDLSFGGAKKTFTGYGVGVTFSSILGLLNIMFARGDENLSSPGNKQTIFYFTAGYKF
jgi:NTE family protein